MKNTSFIPALLGVSISMLVASSAFADHRHQHRDYDDGYRYTQVRYYERENYGRENYGYERQRYDDYGRVLSARPIYQRVAIDVPRDSCHVETYAQESRRGGDSFAGTVVGGLVGAAIGHELGNGRGGATAVGGLIGASIGNDANKSRVVRYRDEEVCNTHYRTEYEQRLVGYDVSYSYLGRIYQTRTDRHPGDRIAVDVNIRSGYRD